MAKIKMSPEERRLAASLAASTKWAHTDDRTAATAPARRAFMDKFEREVDPEGVLPPGERAKRAENARKAYYARLSLAAHRARRRKAEAELDIARADAELDAAGGPAASPSA